MKVQTNQPSGVPPTGYPQDTESPSGSSKFSDVLDKKQTESSTTPSSNQGSTSSTQGSTNTQQPQQTQSNQQPQQAQGQPAANQPAPTAQGQPQAAAGQQPMMEAREAEVGDPFAPPAGPPPFPGQPGEMVARSLTPPGPQPAPMPAEFAQGLASPADPFAAAQELGLAQGPLDPGLRVGADGMPFAGAGQLPGMQTGEVRHPHGREFHERIGEHGIQGGEHAEVRGPHVREGAGDETVPLGEGGLLAGTGDPALAGQASAAHAAHVGRRGKKEAGDDKEFAVKKSDKQEKDELDDADPDVEKLPQGAMQAMLSQQPTPEVQAVERPRPLYEMQQIRSIVQEVRMVTKPGDKSQIEIQLTSKTLDGLQIKIERGEEGRMRIDFMTKNDDVAQLLSRNMQNLSQSLAAHGLRVSNIQVVNPAAQAIAASFAAQPRPIETFSSSSFSDSGRDDQSDRGDRGGRQQGGGDQQGQGGRRGRQ